MKKLVLYSFCLLFGAACSTPKSSSGPNTSFYMPAEYMPQDAVWLGWVDYGPYHEAFLAVAKALYPHVPLKIIVQDSSDLKFLQFKLEEHAMDKGQIKFFVIPDNRLWMRDHGAIYLLNSLGEKKVADFTWGLYGYREYLKKIYPHNVDSLELALEKALGQTGIVDSLMGAKEGIGNLATDIIMEGGSIEVNGKGTLILCEKVTMHRNPDKSKGYIESEFKRVLGVTQIIWLKEGLVEDPFWFNHIFDNYYGWGTNGHTDEFVRFVNDSTILLAWVPEPEKDANKFNQLNYERMSQNLQILEQARDGQGRPFTIIKVPLPDPIYVSTVVGEQSLVGNDPAQWELPVHWLPPGSPLALGDSVRLVAAASYLNYLVSNEVVVLPSYLSQGSSPQKEAEVRAIFSKVFPKRRLKFLEVTNLNYHGGGIHCISQQEPKPTSF